MAVFSLFLGGKENGVVLPAPLFLREMNAGRRIVIKHGAVSPIFFISHFSLSCLPAFSCWADLACELTEQAENDCAWIVHMDWAYREKRGEENALRDIFSGLQSTEEHNHELRLITVSQLHLFVSVIFIYE